jgi:hypothetical protein
MKDEQHLFIDELVALSKLYQTVKEILILTENMVVDQAIYLGPINELRNALDHVMRSFSLLGNDEKRAKAELAKVKEHLLRAGYDGYELIAIGQLDKVQNSPIATYDSDIISRVFPDYYTVYQKELRSIQRELAEIRADKTPEKIIDKAKDNDFDSYLKQIQRLVAINDDISHCIPELERAHEIKNGLKKNDRRWDLKKLAIIAVIAGILTVSGNTFVKSCVADQSKNSRSLPTENPTKPEAQTSPKEQ